MARMVDRHGGSVAEPRAQFVIDVDGRRIVAFAGETVAVAMLAAGIRTLRTSPRDGGPRGAFCFMGSCQECLVRIEGQPSLACQSRVTEGLTVETGIDHG